MLTVREALAIGVQKHTRARMELEELAMRSMEYRLEDGTSKSNLSEADLHYLSDEYKRQAVPIRPP